MQTSLLQGTRKVPLHVSTNGSFIRSNWDRHVETWHKDDTARDTLSLESSMQLQGGAGPPSSSRKRRSVLCSSTWLVELSSLLAFVFKLEFEAVKLGFILGFILRFTFLLYRNIATVLNLLLHTSCVAFTARLYRSNIHYFYFLSSFLFKLQLGSLWRNKCGERRCRCRNT